VGLLTRLAVKIDQRFGWHRLPKPLGLLILAELRNLLRERNLYDTGQPTGLAVPQVGDDPEAARYLTGTFSVPFPTDDGGDGDEPRYLTSRTIDGTFNDLENPLMGSTGTRFGRNFPLEHTYPETEPQVLTPNPRTVSLELHTREEFIPATTLNVLAAAWLQFEVHDWFSHGAPEQDDPWLIDLQEGDAWPSNPMSIHRTRRDRSADPNVAQTWVTADSHWWDGSQIYGRDKAFVDKTRAREDGKLRVDEDGMLPADLEEDLDFTDVPGSHWIGLSILHTLFTLEHNAICDRLKAEYPTWSDDQLYDRARMINGALMAKIHTVDWTPAIIAHPTTVKAMHGQWWGLASERVKRRFGRISSSEVISGIPGSPTDHHGVPYSLTEEFVAVYRMHPLLPDEFAFHSLSDDSEIFQLTFPEVNALHARDRLGECTMPNALYSLGIAHPGAIVLHNYPRFLQQFDRPDGTLIDLCATDIIRTRERGVPRYTKFRELLHMRPVRSFEELTPNPVWREELRRVYGDVDQVDLMSGLYAEPFPKGFGFSDTAFRIFIVMASRRLKSDRFFTIDYTPKVYTEAGLEWIESNSMRSVLLRHFPELAPALEGVKNPFAPWRRTASRQAGRVEAADTARATA
jgi:Animal haem peroxidase